MAAYELEQPVSRRMSSEAGDCVSHLPGDFVFDTTPTLHLQHLPVSGPVQICLQYVRSPQPAKLPSVSMIALGLSICICLPGHRPIKTQLYVLVEALLVVLEYQQIVSTFIDHLLAQLSLAVQRISNTLSVIETLSNRETAMLNSDSCFSAIAPVFDPPPDPGDGYRLIPV